jgi:hypothetical protein
LVSWNIIFIFLGIASPLSSKIWYATHWGLTLSHFTTAILGLLIFGTSLRDKNWKLVLALSLWMSQLPPPEVLAWVLTSSIYVFYRRTNLTRRVKQKLLVSALIQSIFSLGTILYTKFAIAERSERFSGSEGGNKVFQFLISFIRLMYHQILDTNGLLSILVCFAIAFAIFAQLGVRATLLIDNEIFYIVLLFTLTSYIVIPAADAYAYGAPWHNLQIIILSSLLKTLLFYQILNKMAFKMESHVTLGIRKMLFASLSVLSLSISLSLLFPNIERMNDWQSRWYKLNDINSSLIPKTFQKQPLQGDLESEWIKDCY